MRLKVKIGLLSPSQNGAIMMRLVRLLTVPGLIGGMLVAVPAAAVAGAPPANATGCVVDHVDQGGEVVGTSTAPAGAKYGQFSCAGGQWAYAWGATNVVTAPAIQVDPTGSVSVQQVDGPPLNYGITVGNLASLTGAMAGSQTVVVRKAIVTVNDGRVRTPAEIAALLAGKDTTGIKVLGIADQPDAARSVGDIVTGFGGTPPTTVVYFWSELWNRITNAIKDIVNTVVNWASQHCNYWADPPYAGVTCAF